MDGVALWGHAVRVQEERPAWLRGVPGGGGPTTHALAEYGMQLSWAGRNAEAANVLERQIAVSESHVASDTWPTKGCGSLAGYASLSIVYRILGDNQAAVAIANRGIALIQRAAVDGGAEDPHTAKDCTREAARCVAARALAVYATDPQAAVTQMQTALTMSSNSDAVVFALAKQLNDHMGS